jgi:hypothetical protein
MAGPFAGASSQTGACPISMRAQHGAGGEMTRARDGAPAEKKPKGQGQRLTLTLHTADARHIVRATVTVRGMSAGSHITPLLTDGPSRGFAARTVQVEFRAAEDSDSRAEVWAPGLTAVEAVQLDSVTYADGSTWKIAPGSGCSVAPDHLMLIGSR